MIRLIIVGTRLTLRRNHTKAYSLQAKGLHVRIATGNSQMITMVAYIIYLKLNFAKHFVLDILIILRPNFIRKIFVDHEITLRICGEKIEKNE